jgi:hypothetical protein
VEHRLGQANRLPAAFSCWRRALASFFNSMKRTSRRSFKNTYHVPLNPGAQKQFGNAKMNGFSC